MNGYIYKITNCINDKVYIGQTKTSIDKRWHAHKTRYNTGSKDGLYGAMRKYGIENFKIEQILECPIEDLNEMERFYIQKYDSFYNGYNLTLGGDGSPTLGLNEEEVIKKYKELKYITDVAKFFDCCELVISNILHKNNIEIKPTPKFNINSIPRTKVNDLLT